MDGKTCIQCNEFKPLTAFGISFDGQNAKMGFTQRESRKHRCRTCYALRERLGNKLEFIRLYGGQCVCCGEVDPRFLSLDHVKSDGSEHRKDLAFHQIVAYAARHFEPENFQVMCFNCNCARSANGGICPHKDKSLEEYLSYTRIVLEKVGKAHVKSSTVKRIRLTTDQQAVKQALGNLSLEDISKVIAALTGP